MKIAIASDHGGFVFKEALKGVLGELSIQVEDCGCENQDSVDYPDYAARVAIRISEGSVDQGILICTTGIGMCIAANKFPRVRAALCTTPRMAHMARAHNNANVLTLGGELTTLEEAGNIVREWLKTGFEEGGRHARRVGKIRRYACAAPDPVEVYETDPDIYAVLQNETRRQMRNLELIASESYVSSAIRETVGSVLTNKYAEGYPGKRWYDGCENVDKAERLAIERACRVFGAEHANVQPHCGSAANMAVYFAVLKPGDTMLAMDTAHGGHLTHGMKTNFSGRLFNCVHYGLDQKTEQIDYGKVAELAAACRPKLIVAGASAYPRIIDFRKFRAIADDVGAYLMVDMAHIAGLVAAGCHPNPASYAEFVTTTTHKTLMGPRGGMILCRERFAAEIDRQIFPGLQGGPLMHVVAGKAVCLHQAAQPWFKQQQQQIILNAQALAEHLKTAGLRIVSGGTDNHLVLVDLSELGVTGKEAATVLDKAGMTVNKNMIPFDTRSPFVTSGIRLGTTIVTQRGMQPEEMKTVAELIARAIREAGSEKALADIRARVLALTERFPLS